MQRINLYLIQLLMPRLHQGVKVTPFNAYNAAFFQAATLAAAAAISNSSVKGSQDFASTNRSFEVSKILDGGENSESLTPSAVTPPSKTFSYEIDGQLKSLFVQKKLQEV